MRGRGAIRLWALGVSVAVHLFALAALGVFHFSRRGEASSARPAEISVHTIERVLVQPEPKPKPRIESPPAPTVRTVAAEPAAPPAPAPLKPAAETPAAGMPRPAAPTLFFGAETAAGRVCYVVDGSGSMFGLMYLVREQLRESILKLSAEQCFNVVFFMQHGGLQCAFEGRLEAASPAVKAAALNLLGGIRPEGQTHAEGAIEAAMRMRDRSGLGPEVIFFVTDGFDLVDGGGGELIGRVENLRKTLAPNVVMHTIGVYPAREDSAILSQLAKTCGGRYIEIH